MSQDHVYLSYHPKDARLALQLALDLKGKGLDVWFDRVEGLLSTENWLATIGQAVEMSYAVISLISHEYMSTDYCTRELEQAAQRELVLLAVIVDEECTQSISLLSDPEKAAKYYDLTKQAYATTVQKIVSDLSPVQPPQTSSVTLTEVKQYLKSLLGNVQCELAGLGSPYAGTELLTARPDPREHLFLAPCLELYAPRDGELVKSETEFESLEDVAKIHPQFLVIGAPGVGKTVLLLRQVLSDIVRALQDSEDGPFPLYLSLSTWMEDTAFEDFLLAEWPLKVSLVEAVSKGYVNFYLDDLEVLDEAEAEASWRLRHIRKWYEQQPSSTRLVGCCTSAHAADISWLFPQVRLYVDDRKVQEFAEYYLANEAIGFVDWVHSIRVRFRHLPGQLWELTSSLRFLAGQIDLYQYTKPPLASLSIGLICDMLINILWHTAHSPETEHADWNTAQDVLSQVAIRALATGANSISLDALPQEGEKNFDNVLAKANRGGLLKILRQHVHFPSSFILDYFVALALFDYPLEKLQQDALEEMTFHPLMGRVPRDWDRPVATFSALLEEPDQFVAWVARADPWLAALCVAYGASVSEELHAALQEALLHLLVEGDSAVRLACINALRLITDRRIIPSLISLLADSSLLIEERATASTTHEKAGEEDIRDLFSAELAQAAFEGFWKIALIHLIEDFGEEAIPALVRLLNDPLMDNPTRVWAGMTLGRIKSPAVVPAFSETLSTEPNMAFLLAPLLGNLGPEALQGLHALLSTEHSSVQAEALMGINLLLKQIDGEEGKVLLPDLLRALKAEQESVYLGAGVALAQLHTVALPFLLDALREEEPLLQERIIQVLEVIGEAAIPGLIKFLPETDTNLCFSVARALAGIGSVAEPALLTALQTGTGRTRLGAAWALGIMGNHTRETLIGMLHYPHREVRLAVISGLGIPGIRDAVAPLIGLLDEQDEAIRYAVVSTLGAIREPIAVGPLAKCLEDGARPVTFAAIEALGKIGSDSAMNVLIEKLQEEDEELRLAVTQALWTAGDSAVPQLVNAFSHCEQHEIQMILGQVLVAIGEPGYQALLDLEKKAAGITRFYTLVALGWYESSLESRLSQALQDSDETVQLGGITALARQATTGDKQALLILLEEAATSNWFVAMQITDLLASIFDGQVGMELLSSIAADISLNSLTRSMAAIILGSLDCGEELLQFLSSQDRRDAFLMLTSALALTLTESIGTDDYLDEFLEDDDPYIRTIINMRSVEKAKENC